ncbi:MAG: hypothetical protein ABIO86_02585 [Sphingomonas sp.]
MWNRSIAVLAALAAIAAASAATHDGRQNPAAPVFSAERDGQKVRAILKRIDADVTDTSIYVDDVVHMAQGSRAITNRAQLRRVLLEEATHGRSDMTHEVLTISSYPDIVLTRGRVTGTWHPADGGAPVPFETNNMITFRRAKDGSLKIWQVIFNRVDLARYLTSPKTARPEEAR